MSVAATARVPRAGAGHSRRRHTFQHPPHRRHLTSLSMKPDPDPHVHFVEELAELMLRYLLAVNAAARARRLAGHLSGRGAFTAPQPSGRHWKRKGKAHRRQGGKASAATGKGWQAVPAGAKRTKRSTPPFRSL